MCEIHCFSFLISSLILFFIFTFLVTYNNALRVSQTKNQSLFVLCSSFLEKHICFLVIQSMDRSISSTKGEIVHVEVVNTDDWISKLSNDLLLKILSKLSTKEVIRTSLLSERWANVWKKTSQLCLDMRTIAKTTTLLPDVSHQAAKSVTKVYFFSLIFSFIILGEINYMNRSGYKI